MFPLVAFTADTVAKLTGLSITQLQRWDRSGFFVPSFADPDRRRPYSRIYSFTDVVGLRTIASLREQAVTFPELKKVREFFARHSNEDWANRRFYVVGRRVFFSHEDAVVAARPLGQQVSREVVDLGPIVNEVQSAVRELPKRQPEEIGTITTDRAILGGAPILAGTRIPTATVDWFHLRGYGSDDILRKFPRLDPADVDAAIAFEVARRESVEDPLAAVG